MYGQLNSNECPRGSTPIDVSACRSFANAANIIYNGEAIDGKAPKGCYSTSSGSFVRFNPHEVGAGGVNLRVPVCAVVTTPTAGLTPTGGPVSRSAPLEDARPMYKCTCAPCPKESRIIGTNESLKTALWSYVLVQVRRARRRRYPVRACFAECFVSLSLGRLNMRHAGLSETTLCICSLAAVE